MSDQEARTEVPMELNLRVDVLDADGIWNTGVIVDVNQENGENMVEIKYDGWGDEYNEWIGLDEHRLAPLHMYTMVKKCWAKLTKWPWWPAFVVLRAPTRKAAAEALNAETKVYVEFFDSYSSEKRSRCWMQKKNIASFQEGFDERASKNIGKNFPAYVEGTQRALAGGSPVLFSGNGTLPIEYSSKYAEPLARRKQALAEGDEDKWHDAYRVFSGRYRLLYGYEFARDPAKKMLAAHHAKHAKGKHTKSAGIDEEEDDDDDDEVEIIETKPAPPAKRGRGRPPGKQAKKQPKVEEEEGNGYQDEDESEEKDVDEEYQDAGDDQDDEDDDADEEPESPRGRRSARITKKRKSLDEEAPVGTRRSTRPRRTPEMQDRDDASREEEDAPPTRHHRHDRGIHAPPRKGNLYEIDHSELDDGSATDESRPQSKKSNSPVRRVSVRPLKSNFNRTALKELIAAAPPQPTVQSPTEASTSTPAKPIVMVPLMQSGSETPVSTSSSRRKQSNPKSIADLEQSNRDKAVSTPAHTAPGSNPLRHWLGFGAFDEGAAGPGRKPWSIQSWILDGFRRMQSSEAHAKNAKDE